MRHDLPLEKFVCRSGSNSSNWAWNNILVPNRKRSSSRLYIVTLLKMSGWMKLKLESRLLGEISITSDMQMTPPLWVKEQSEKAGLKFNIQKTKIMASGSITSWEIDGETVETVSDFIFWAPKSLQMVTAAIKLKDAYSLEEKL